MSQPTAPPPGLAIVRALAPLVPAPRRAEWLAEWHGELAHSAQVDGVSPWRLRLRALGAATDALWLRRHAPSSTAHPRSLMLARDLRHAVRGLRRRPGFAAIVVGTLALCIGASTAVFSIVESVLLSGVDYPGRERLVALWSSNPKEGNDRYQVSVGDYRDWRARARAYAQVAGFFPIWNATWTAPSVAERLQVGVVSANFLRTLQVAPRLGRDFAEEEDRPGAAPVAILTHAFWTRAFAADPGVLGRTIVLDGQPYVVAGVMGADFAFPQNRVDVMVPLPILGNYLDRRGVHMLSVIARLRPGATVEGARTELAAIARQLRREHPAENAGLGVTVRPLVEDLLGDVRRPIEVLFGAVCAVLLIGCANVANLMLVRAAARRREFAVRSAIGARPEAIVRQVLAESVVVATAAALLGVAIAVGATHRLAAVLPESIARVGAVRVNGAVLAFTLGTCVLAALLCGVVPAVQAVRGVEGGSLHDATRGSTGGRDRRRVQRTLVVGEIALALVLVASAGLLVNSFGRLTRTDVGFRGDHLVRMKLALPDARYPQGARRTQFFDALLARARALPGVHSAAAINRFPLHDGNLTTQVAVEGMPAPADLQYPASDFRQASEAWFTTMGIPLLAGRDFAMADGDSGAPPVAIVNRSAALRLFGAPTPVGRRFQMGGARGPFLTVVGVVGDVHDASLREAPHAQLFLYTRQVPPSAVSLVLRHDGDAAPLVAAVRRLVTEADPTLPLYDVQTGAEVLAAASVGDRFDVTLLAAFALLALLLAGVGTYGVISYGVAERTREIGVRLALGARPGRVVRMVLREGLLLFGVAFVLGALGTWWASRALAGLLYDLSPSDPRTLAAAVGTMAVATAVACVVPARRASRVDPAIAMRAEG